MSLFARKLYALLAGKSLCLDFQCLTPDEHRTISAWWTDHKTLLEAIASSSDPEVLNRYL
ncbi:hypothetical protein K4A83_22685 [Spirulina subsalsa FACHB-351]|uniref:Uncharacterized protein n=1 Tax=Spirulina subsalsa FACHB-351 TaxID=234711 RepID=A0ABT3LC39_9CYAN|nr:hypothetical protein [Spirulina subsalsa]MCW6039032.1 hypothetical protein [Spirulina subsalsa FACHB-351]